MYTSWSWSSGETETYYRSPKMNKPTNDPHNQSLVDYSQNQDADLINITNGVFSRNQNVSGTRREDIDSKMATREMLAQRGVNPFLQTSYVNDIVTRDMFMKPINTTQGRVKQDSNSNSNNTNTYSSII